MRVKVAESAGFCFGVLRATEMAFKAASGNDGNVYSLGPIIHNPQVVESLKKMGVRMVLTPNALPQRAKVILRSHGVEKNDVEILRSKGCALIEATCPFVKKVHKAVQELSKRCDLIVVVGDADHPEIKATLSFAPGRAVAITGPDSVHGLPKVRAVGVVAQTTLSSKILDAVVERCRQRYEVVEAVNTICSATSIRQKEAVDLAGKVDAMVVVGGFDSANTKRLAGLCGEILPKSTFHVEKRGDLPMNRLSHFNVVGVTAGASTPSRVIEEVVQALVRQGFRL
ncbi:MAG: 4-hydroxy-3-methylbut-2-enyl diphosphate reductase [Deltaproteobacteria bacterium]|nr:4-hydroxy-3-methylbut-2-enyl diphosphate reductase [Deltaproteobacteria bacterium]